MTVVAAEAAEAGAGRAGYARSSASVRKKAPRKTAVQSQREAQARKTTAARTDEGPRHARERPTRESAARDKAAQQPSQDSGSPGPVGMRQAVQAAKSVKLAPGDRAYQPVLLAEFLAAVVIVALIPLATGGSDTAKAKGGMSPYDANDLTQLVAVGAVYFVLALASSGNSGRLSAWLGGLILIAIAMGKLAHGNLSAVFNAVSPGKGVEQFGPSADPFASGQ